MIVDQQYIHTSHPYCPRPHSMYLWCRDQTVRVELEAKALGKAIMNDLSVEGYTRTHYSKWPANIRAAESHQRQSSKRPPRLRRRSQRYLSGP